MDKSPWTDNDAANAELAKGKVALKGFFAVAALWACSPEEEARLLAVPVEQVARLRACQPTILSNDTARRISNVLCVEAALMLIYGEPERVAHRLRQVSFELPFDNQSPLDYMMEGPGENLGLACRFFSHRANSQ